MFMRRSEYPFAEGEVQIAYHGQLSRYSKDLDLEKSSMVLKSFKYTGKGVHTMKHYLKQMEVSKNFHLLAEEFNTSEWRPNNCATVHFFPVCVIEEEIDSRDDNGDRHFCNDTPLPGGGNNFTNYSSNTGYWNKEFLDETLLLFTVWTYHATKGYLMVVYLQGVRKGGRYNLTDPVILCTYELRFGHTNLGLHFMKNCIESTNTHLDKKVWLSWVPWKLLRHRFLDFLLKWPWCVLILWPVISMWKGLLIYVRQWSQPNYWSSQFCFSPSWWWCSNWR